MIARTMAWLGQRQGARAGTGRANFLLIWAGQLVSAIGTRLSSFAMGVYILHTTGSTMQFAMTFVAMDIPAMLAAPFAGALVDRWDRRRVMMACDAVSAATMLAMAGLLATDQLRVWQIYIGVAIGAVCTTFHAPAFCAAFPCWSSASSCPG